MNIRKKVIHSRRMCLTIKGHWHEIQSGCTSRYVGGENNHREGGGKQLTSVDWTSTDGGPSYSW